VTPCVVAIIPARLASTRLPGKVLLARTGKPLIRHVYEAALKASRPSRFVIAADDVSVAKACAAFNAEVVMTRVDHPNGTSRLAEACDLLGLADDVIAVNVQGDEPELDASLIDAAVGALEQTGAEVATIASPFMPGEDPANPNVVKVVCRADSTAMYFSRSLIPFRRDAAFTGEVKPLKHVGLYVYRVGFLRRYVSLPATALEQTESLEQLRVLWHGFRIAVAVRESRGQGIDTPEQYEAFVRKMQA
jgi:3-deoxy-manno-octulosonate cytidylyltransferase (CMP-KDO synthetase)